MLQRLGARDAHCANIAFEGEYPCLLDCETLIQPRLACAADRAPSRHAWLAESVLSSAMLGPRGRWLRGSIIEQATIGMARTTAGMAMALPHLAGEPQHAGPFIAQVVEGYDEAHRHIDYLREALLTDDGPLRRLAAGRYDCCRARPRSTARSSGASMARAVAVNRWTLPGCAPR
ncbi:MAG: DUF4135 domain-containing protein [Proteobacteria bacterium]|nr:DUF4135 domain-containing protein [Pseudomonadota bacterium]